jgi:hypothetical protein
MYRTLDEPTVRGEVDPDLLPVLQDYFGLIGMHAAVDILAQLDPDKEVMGATRVRVNDAQDIVTDWQVLSPQSRFMSAVMVVGIRSGLVMTLPQDYNPNSAHWTEWVGKQMSQWDEMTRRSMQRYAIDVVVAAHAVVGLIKEGTEGGKHEQVN